MSLISELVNADLAGRGSVLPCYIEQGNKIVRILPKEDGPDLIFMVLDVMLQAWDG